MGKLKKPGGDPIIGEPGVHNQGSTPKNWRRVSDKSAVDDENMPAEESVTGDVTDATRSRPTEAPTSGFACIDDGHRTARTGSEVLVHFDAKEVSGCEPASLGPLHGPEVHRSAVLSTAAGAFVPALKQPWLAPPL